MFSRPARSLPLTCQAGSTGWGRGGSAERAACLRRASLPRQDASCPSEPSHRPCPSPPGRVPDENRSASCQAVGPILFLLSISKRELHRSLNLIRDSVCLPRQAGTVSRFSQGLGPVSQGQPGTSTLTWCCLPAETSDKHFPAGTEVGHVSIALRRSERGG